MVLRFCGSKCVFAFVGAFYISSLLEAVISASVNKPPDAPLSALYVQTRPTNSSFYNRTDQLHYSRYRRKLPNESGDEQFNSLDDLQFQEYQGVFGRPGVDFPVFSHIPLTKFNCRDVKNSNTGYYADLDTHCQVFHVCDGGRKVSFLCPNGTIFRQSHLICDWWFRVECERSPELYDQSVHMLEADQHVYKQRAETITNAMHNLLAKGIKESMLVESPVSVLNKFNSESELPKSIPDNAYNPIATSRPNFTLFDVNNNGYGVTPPTPSQASYNFQNFEPVTPSSNNFNQPLPEDGNFSPMLPTAHTPPSRNQQLNTNSPFQDVKYNFNGNTNQPPPEGGNFSPILPTTRAPPSRNQQLNTNSPFQDVKYNFNGNNNQPSLEDGNFSPMQPTTRASPSRNQQLNTNSPFQDVKFDFNTNTITFPQPTSNPAPTPARSMSPPPFRSNSNWAPFHNFNSLSLIRNAFNEQKSNPSSPHKHKPINVPNFTPGRFPLEQNPTTRFSATPPRSTVSATLPPRTSYTTDFTTLPPAFTKSYFTTISTPYETSSVVPFTTPPRSNIFSNTYRPKTKQTQTPYYTSTSISTPSTTVDNKYFGEQQILAETASFADNSKFPNWQNYYFPQNFNTQTKPTAASTTVAPEITTFSLYDMLFDNKFPHNTNQSYALYFPSDENVIDLLNLVTPEPEIGVTEIQRNFSKPSVSELLLNSFGTSVDFRGSTSPATGETFPILLRNETKDAYNQLFSKPSPTSSSDLLLENSNGLVQSSSPKTLPSAESLNEKLKFKSSPDFRELAQIFSRALSAYLEDPEQFRKILSEVRPTEPPPPEALAKSQATHDEVLAFSEDERTTPRSASSSTMRNPETFAEEINNFMFDSAPFQPHTEGFEFNVNETYFPTSSYTAKPTTAISFAVSPLIDVPKSTLTPSSTFGTTFPESIPQKNNLYEDKNNQFSDNNEQTLQEEPFLVTADTQSFVAPENLVRYPLYGKYSGKYTLSPPNLKSPAYPQFGMRTSSSSFTATPFISSRADFVTSAPTTISSIVGKTTFSEESLRTTLNVLSPETLKPLFNESAVNAMMDIMQEAKTNPSLRNKLVLLLVSDRNVPENRSVKDLKSKLLKALLVPSSTKAYDIGVTERPVSRRKVRKEGRVVTARRAASTTPLYHATDISKSNTHVITRTRKSTARPIKQVESDGLTDTDTRAVDLLKTLYSIASNNWNR